MNSPANARGQGDDGDDGSVDMELGRVQSNLHALKKLYGLLQINENELQNTSSKNLDEKARFLLKKLLDGAAEEALQLHSKIRAGQLGSSINAAPTKEPPKELQSLVSWDKSKTSDIRNWEEEPNCLPGVDQSKSKQTSPATIPRETRKLKVAVTESQNRNKSCAICEKSNLKRLLHSAKEKRIFSDENPRHRRHHNSDQRDGVSSTSRRIIDDDMESKMKAKENEKKSIKKPISKRIRQIQRNLSTVSSLSDYSDATRSPAMLVRSQSRLNLNLNLTEKNKNKKKKKKKAEKTMDVSEEDQKKKKAEKSIGGGISEEVASAIQQIEARILADQQLAWILYPVKDKNVTIRHQSGSMVHSIGDSDQVGSKLRMKDMATQTTDEFTETNLTRNDSLSQKVISQKRRKADTTLPDQLLFQAPAPKPNAGTSELTTSKVTIDGSRNQEAASLSPGQMVSQTRNPAPASIIGSQMGWKTKETTLPLLSQARDAVADKHDLPSQKDGRSIGTVKPGLIPSQASKFVADRNGLPSQLSQKERIASQAGKPPIHERNELVSQSVRKAKRTDFLDQMPSQSSDKNKKTTDLLLHREKNREMVTSSRPLMPAQKAAPTIVREVLVGPQLKQGKSRSSEGGPTAPNRRPTQTKYRIPTKNDLPHQMIVRPTLLDRKSGRMTVEPIRFKDPSDRERRSIHNSAQAGPLRKKPLPRRQTAKIMSSSSTWTTEETSSSESQSEEEEEEDQLIPHRMGPTSRHMGPTPKMRRNVALDKSCFRENSPHRIKGRYAVVGSQHEEDLKSAGNRNHTEKKIGRLRRIKDKLAIIFHHHHHHHHHLHNEGDESTDETEVGHATSLNHHHHHHHHHHNRSLGKYLPRILHRKSKDDRSKHMAEIYGERVTKNIGKNRVRIAPRQHQHGHLHALLDGLLRHVWHSKKSKPSGPLRIRRPPGQMPKIVKKLHWWQNFHRRGVKLANSGKPRVKLGFRSKRPQLRAGKTT